MLIKAKAQTKSILLITGTTVEDLHKQIFTVRERQRQFLAHFSDNYNENYFYDSERYVDEVCVVDNYNSLKTHSILFIT